MARAPNENLEKAFKLYKKGLKLIDISKELNIPAGTIRRWKSTYKWDSERSEKNSERSNKKGGQPGNKNASGNRGGAPKGNKRAEKHGFFSKYLPKDTFNIIKDIEVKNPLDILWENIQIQYAAIIRAQKIMHVKSQEDFTKVLKKESNGESSYTVEYELQFAWDKQANFLQAQSRAMKTLEGMIKSYDDLLHKNWDLATEEQKLRIKTLKSKINDDEAIVEDDGFIDALEGKVDEVWEE